jgi:hypothetical protein
MASASGPMRFYFLVEKKKKKKKHCSILTEIATLLFHVLFNNLNNNKHVKLFYVVLCYVALIKKFAQTTPSVDGAPGSSFFGSLLL